MNTEEMQNRQTVNYGLRNIPKKVYDKIRKNAEANGRSINSEILMILKNVEEVK